MSQLLIHPYLDEDVSVLVAQLLRARGFAATTTVEAGQRQADDADQLTFATARDMTIVTHNHADFEMLASEFVASNKHHAGIIVAVRRSPYELARRLLRILDQVTADEMADQLRYI